jgi:FkbM family methyltransferase
MLAQNNAHQSFLDGFRESLKLFADIHHVKGIEFTPLPGSPLFKPDNEGNSISCSLQVDAVMCPAVLTGQQWEVIDLKWISEAMRHAQGNLTLVDVGANSGLFARQALIHSTRFGRLYAYEPNPTNYRHLCFNLSCFGNISLNNFALAGAGGDMEFYLDPRNAGNYSLNQAAMPSDFTITRVAAVSAATEAERWAAEGQPIFYKSDTQGFDESIATHISYEIWDQIYAGFFELWRIKKPADVKWEKFRAILDRFPFKTFTNDGEIVSTAEVMEYINAEDGRFKDLFFCRHAP